MSSTFDLQNELLDAGLIVDEIKFNELVRCPTIDKPKSKNGWYKAFDNPLMVTYGNWATGQKERFIAQKGRTTLSQWEQIQQHKAESERQARIEQQENLRKLNRLLKDCYPIEGTPAERYLKNRGINDLTNGSGALLYCPTLDYWEDGQCTTHPAMIAKVTNRYGQLVSLHRTYLTHDGYKADVSISKKLMPSAGSMEGVSIKLGLPIPNTEGTGLMLGIAEGIETALSASELYSIPVWSGISTYGLESFNPPAGVKQVIFFADNDVNKAGEKAAIKGAKRLQQLGITPRLAMPEYEGDWNDILQQEKAGK
ncbi:Uncharacterized protein conserved in bacteria [Oligella urethralis]|uniref:DUF7146 domain-containing protein n=1 Tax=Oligella urethralis TaxID=90245 RepID=UPI000E06EA21|nr:toprim domain-containing protein [Oligella urethralis]SUA63006.1 Uncharacterized protein conserved in bacteria [Oligella urethralis]